ncbi:MAG TPA: hypothetical protein VK185_00695 [Candidatus Bathyarchaeia archaeon]|nr:hypothetical protein [Candidatus Bathyarchaeia archaeon]HLO26676.1 hypothetical protein [Geobacteraceae bacterium]
MNEQETIANLNELGESEYRVLKDTYCRLQEMRTAIATMHDSYAASGAPPEFVQVEALHLQMEEVYARLERFLLPLCAESSCGPSTCLQER